MLYLRSSADNKCSLARSRAQLSLAPWVGSLQIAQCFAQFINSCTNWKFLQCNFEIDKLRGTHTYTTGGMLERAMERVTIPR